jgi:MFS transporter, DHA2 family, multidrug resistance protein
MALLLVLGPRLLPEYRDPGAGRLDLRSAAMSLAAVLGVIFGLKQIAQDGVHAPALLWLAAGAALAVAFARRQGRLAHPLIDLRLFRVPAFSAALASNLLGFFAIFGASLFTAQYLQSVLGLSPLEAGLWTLPEALGFIVSSMLTPRLVRHFPVPAVIAGGLMVGAAGLALVAQVDGDLAPLVAGSLVVALGLGPVATLATDLAVGLAPPERAGAAAAVSETSSELGGALGIAILGSIAAAVYRAGAPEGARDTIGGAVATADPAVADAACEAFTQGMQVAASIAAAVLVAAAVVVLAMFRRRGGEPAVALAAC